MSARLSWPDAVAAVTALRGRLEAEQVPLADSVDRILVEPIRALTDVPHFASAAMDGWAVAGSPPWTVNTELLMRKLDAGQATPIVTGAPIPVGADAVLRSEHGRVLTDSTAPRLHPTADLGGVVPHPGHHIRPAGEEARAGEEVFPVGTRMTPAHVAVAAACGHDTLSVVRTPRVGLLFTGTEIVEDGIPVAGKVRDSFGPQFPSLLNRLGAVVQTHQLLGDSAAELRNALSGELALQCDVVITTGGTGGSAVDHLHPVLEHLGARLVADGVKMRPGGPTVIAQLKDGRVFIGLPGNPLAAMMGFTSFVVPLLTRLRGVPSPVVGSIIVGAALPGRNDTTNLVPYEQTHGNALPTRWHGSAMMRGLATADGIIVVPPQGLVAGDRAETLQLPWGCPAS
ncbi:MAG TPA: molybdopterin molybdotransferase MoeA [Glaciihabitans sp.]|jgi:molybdopterin molybdotransferase|nr:molybdopterin molybdotransferase MoeA [Glaciihabitans sp.]